LSLDHQLVLENGERLTALALQQKYLDLARAVAADDAETAQLFAQWEETLSALATDPSAVAAQVEWVGKWQVLEAMRARHKVGWDDPQIIAANIHWSDLRPNGLAQRLRAAGVSQALISDAEATAAVNEPPTDTRAWFRGMA